MEKLYPPAYQLALDMFKRLGQSAADIYDVLLTKDHVGLGRWLVLVKSDHRPVFQLLQALRLARSQGKEAIATMQPRRFLEAAKATGDDMLFYAGEGVGPCRRGNSLPWSKPILPPFCPESLHLFQG